MTFLGHLQSSLLLLKTVGCKPEDLPAVDFQMSLLLGSTSSLAANRALLTFGSDEFSKGEVAWAAGVRLLAGVQSVV